MLRSRRARAALVLASVAWGMSVVAGLVAVHSYESTPGRPPGTVPTWPLQGRIPFDPSRANLVVAAHPRCPCTRASLKELGRVMERCQGAVVAHILFYQPGSGRDPWRSTELQRLATAIPGVRVYDDPGGAEAGRFGAETSGTVLLYDRSGRRCYAGGITSARGQSGDNPGLDAVIAQLSGQETAPAAFPVFGCPIRSAPKIGSAQ
jgi:hypothetical protein